MKYCEYCQSPLGPLTLESDGEALTGLWFGKREGEVAGASLRVFAKAEDWLRRYFSGERPLPSELPLRPEGTDFRRLVWGLLLEIPYGETASYSDIAKKAAAMMNRPVMSARAVGGAVGHNPISIIIPCHRVIGKDGSLTGFGLGAKMLDKKAFLLRLEGHDVIF